MLGFKRRDGKPLKRDQDILCSSGCKGTFKTSDIKPVVRFVDEKNGVTRTYFTCPLCGQEYTAFYEDKQCRIWQGMKEKSSPEFVRKLQERINERMKLLKEKYEVE